MFGGVEAVSASHLNTAREGSERLQDLGQASVAADSNMALALLFVLAFSLAVGALSTFLYMDARRRP